VLWTRRRGCVRGRRRRRCRATKNPILPIVGRIRLISRIRFPVEVTVAAVSTVASSSADDAGKALIRFSIFPAVQRSFWAMGPLLRAAGADVVRDPVGVGHAGVLHVGAGVRGVDESTAADVDAFVAKAVEEDQVTGL
jgi:hypothetical protein